MKKPKEKYNIVFFTDYSIGKKKPFTFSESSFKKLGEELKSKAKRNSAFGFRIEYTKD